MLAFFKVRFWTKWREWFWTKIIEASFSVVVSGRPWAIPPVRLGLSGRNSGKIPERPRKRSQSISWNFPREYGWDAPNPIIQGIWGFQSVSRILSPPVRLGTPLFQKRFRRGPLRAGLELPAVLGLFSSGFSRGKTAPLGRNWWNAPLRSENGPLRRRNGPLRPRCWLAFQSTA